MKYLFAALDAREDRLATSPHLHTKHRYSVSEIKKIVIETNDGLDEKNSLAEFTDTLERIVNEIRNTTEHSTAFLQKVRKADVPDYYDVIKNPMDLGTLLKKVKQHAYHTKKEFADDLDLIWSNCLLYNSHPSHPLRKSAEFLRTKSNQLLEFISDPQPSTLPIQAMKDEILAEDDVRSRTELEEAEASASAPPGSATPDVKPTIEKKVLFEDTQAIVRTAETMSRYTQLDEFVSQKEESTTRPSLRLSYASSLFAAPLEVEGEDAIEVDREDEIEVNGDSISQLAQIETLLKHVNGGDLRGLVHSAPELAWWEINRTARDSAVAFSAFPPVPYPPGTFPGDHTIQGLAPRVNAVSQLFLSRAGFDRTSTAALDLFGDVLTAYVGRVGQAVRDASETLHATRGPAGILLSGLQDAGVESYSVLLDHIDVERAENEDYKEKRRLARDAMDVDQEDAPHLDVPPPFVPLSKSSIGSQIGLLQGIYNERLKSSYGLTEDHALVADQATGEKRAVLRPSIGASGQIAKD